MHNSPQDQWTLPAGPKKTAMPYMTAIACAICAVIFVGINLEGENATWAQVGRWGYLPARDIWEGKPWVLLTSVFVHQEIWHVAFNMYWLWHLGGCLEEIVGPFRWLVFFVSAALVSSAAQLTSGDPGIGMSGVGYALFGFGWLAQDKMPAFKKVLNEQTVWLFLIWLLLCVVLTFFNIMNIGNEAHLGGLVFGTLVAVVFVRQWHVGLALPGLLILFGLSFVPLFWCPLSPDWTSQQAMQAHDREDYPTAIHWYKRSLALGDDASWAWSNLARIYGYQEDHRNYAEALRELRKVDEKEAREVESMYGSTATAPQK